MLEPRERLRRLTAVANVEVKKTIKPLMYFRSGADMRRMSKVYIKEQKYETAYIICIRYCTLFLEKIQEHPEYDRVPESEKKIVRVNMKEALEEAETLRKVLLEKFEREHKEYLKQKELSLEREAKLAAQRKEESTISVPSAPSYSFVKEYNDTPTTGPLRRVIIPATLIAKFLEKARINTNNNIETCGLLTGILQRDVFIVTTLLIPQQSGTSDDCNAEDDVGTFNVLDTNGLLTLGWIHTHPSQQAFLSSVDQHSQFGYQSMLPEALAIVCAPRYTNEVFRLSELGLEVVGDCTKTGFHPHPNQVLFEVANHVKFDDIPCQVIDLRKSG